MIQRIDYNKDMKVSPDFLYIPEYNIDIYYGAKGSFPVSVCSTGTFIGEIRSTHSLLHKRIEGESILDWRIWTYQKCISAWISSVYALNILKRSIDDIINKSATYLSANTTIGNIDSYDIYFVGWELHGNSLIKCNYCDLQYLIDSGLVPCDNIRTRVINHVATPLRKHRVLRNNPVLRTENFYYYKESCRMWRNKIKTMDVAEYHLLIYEE